MNESSVSNECKCERTLQFNGYMLSIYIYWYVYVTRLLSNHVIDNTFFFLQTLSFPVLIIILIICTSTKTSYTIVTRKTYHSEQTIEEDNFRTKFHLQSSKVQFANCNIFFVFLFFSFRSRAMAVIPVVLISALWGFVGIVLPFLAPKGPNRG